ncbi:MAG: copper-binding protein, partial [Casimicrobiaceae bacterium]
MRTIAMILALSVAAAAPAYATEKPAGDLAASNATATPAAAPVMTEGEVRKIDKDAKKITIKHGEIANLGMPSMTMVFQVKDPAALARLKQGDKVRFHVEKEGSSMVVTQLEP